MTQPKFTPGPWNIHRSYPLDMPIRRTDPTSDVPAFDYWRSVIAQGDTVIAESMMQNSNSGGWPHVTDLEEAKANTSLITAAPDLYAALVEARQYVVMAYECAFPDAEANAEVLADIDTALTKAGRA